MPITPVMTTLAIGGFGGIGWQEILIVLGVGLVVFGRRLPEVGRNLGRGLVEFKKGLRGIEDDVNDPMVLDESLDQPKLDADQTDTQTVTPQKQPDKAEA